MPYYIWDSKRDLNLENYANSPETLSRSGLLWQARQAHLGRAIPDLTGKVNLDGLGSRVQGLRFRVYGIRFRV